MTEKITHDLVQGTPQWDAFRLQHFGASEAAAMLGLSKKVTRPQLLQAKKTGIAREFSDWLQANVLDYGHEVEALARPLVEAKIGDELYPVTCSRGKLSASCDGITLDDRIAFEHKQWNEGLAAMVATGIVPDEHMPQCQQIMLVTGAEKVIFTVSDGTPEKMVYTEVLPDQAWFDRLVRGWAQFEADLETFEPPTAVAPAPTGRAPESLPALLVQVTGAVTASNLAEFKEIALSAIRKLPEASTDEWVAVIGCGGRGAVDLQGVSGEDIVALCDVDDNRAAKSFEANPKAKRFKDFRQMFDKMSNEIDAVVVATPDHTHAAACLPAMLGGPEFFAKLRAKFIRKTGAILFLGIGAGVAVHALGLV